MLDGVREIGSGTVAQRLWATPAITVIGITTTPIDKASNTLIPRAQAKISLRVAPGGESGAHLDALRRHLEQHAPWGAKVTVTPGDVGQPYAIDAGGPVYDAARAAFRQAWGVDPVDMGMGGSIPFIAEFAAARFYNVGAKNGFSQTYRHVLWETYAAIVGLNKINIAITGTILGPQV
jgi:acetylornithine deacetylase/succinyl-diaminopimelate desuccinylase-like protein